MVHDSILLTSIPPTTSRLNLGVEVGSRYQQQCVESWVAAGFHVISVNPESEIDSIRDLNLPLEAVSLEGERGPPQIASMIRMASSVKAKLCGIINADCMLMTTDNLSTEISDVMDGGLWLSERIDIDAEGEAVPGNCSGFDGFFFRPSEIGTDFDEHLRIGDPWWDYWFPCVAALRGIEVHRLAIPLLTHLVHPYAWDARRWHANGEYFRREMILRMPHSNNKGLVALLAKTKVQTAPLPKLGNAVHSWLRDQSPISHVSQNHHSIFDAKNVLRSLREYHSAQAPNRIKKLEKLEARIKKLEKLETRLASVKHAVTRSATNETNGSPSGNASSTLLDKLRRRASRMVGCSQMQDLLARLALDWLKNLRFRSYFVFVLLISSALILIAAPFFSENYYEYLMASWGGALGFVAITVILCCFSFSRHVLRNKIQTDDIISQLQSLLDTN